MNEIIKFDKDKWTEDDLQRIQKVTLPLRWLLCWFYQGKIDPATTRFVDQACLDLPQGCKVVGAFLSPGGMCLEVYITHPSFEARPIWEPVKNYDGLGYMMYCLALKLLDQPAEDQPTVVEGEGG
jgi:hypothetical protein